MSCGAARGCRTCLESPVPRRLWQVAPPPFRPALPLSLSLASLYLEGARCPPFASLADGLGSQGDDTGSRRTDGILLVAHGCASSSLLCDFCRLRDPGRRPLLGFSISTSSRFALPVVEWSRPERSLEGAPGL
jgi:hypothetical protein